MDVPEDEDGLIRHVKEKFGDELDHYAELKKLYKDHKYPDQLYVDKAIALIKDVLSQQNDNIALLKRIIQREDDLYDMKQNFSR